VVEGPLAQLIGNASGKVKGGLHIFGPIGSARLTGKCRMYAANFSNIGLTDVLGYISYGLDESGKAADPQPSVLRMKLDSVAFQSIPITEITARALLSNQSGEPSLQFETFQGKLARGIVTASGATRLSERRPFNLAIELKGVDPNQILVDLYGKKNEMTGSVDLDMNLDGKFEPEDAFLKSLNGSGKFQAVKGRIAKLSELQIKVEQGNLLESGVLGFNIANVLSTVNPLENGEFLSASGRFKIVNGIINMEDLVFHGEELQLQASGILDLLKRRLNIMAKGAIPRVVVQGGVSRVTSLLSFSGIVDFVAKEIPFHTPEIPVVGELSSKSMRTFEFDVDGSLDQPETINQSIRKSFRWTGEQKGKKGTAAG